MAPTPRPGPAIRKSPRKAPPSAQHASTMTPTGSGGRKKTSPQKTATAKKTLKAPTRAAAKSASPAQFVPAKPSPTKLAQKTASPRNKSLKKRTGRKRGPPDEDDSGYDPEQTLDDILSEFDGRTRTRLDRLLIDQIRQREGGGVISPNFARAIGKWEANGQADCNYKLYWRFRKLHEEAASSGSVFPPTRSPRRPVSESKARGPTRSPNKLVHVPLLSPSKGSASRASSGANRAGQGYKHIARRTSVGRHAKPSPQPDQRDSTEVEILDKVQHDAYLTTLAGHRLGRFETAPEAIALREFEEAQKRGKQVALKGRREATLRSRADGSEPAIPATVLDTGLPQARLRQKASSPSKNRSPVSRRQMSTSQAPPSKSSPGRGVSSTPRRKMARSPTKSGPQTLALPVQEPFNRKDHDYQNDDPRLPIGADSKDRGTIVPPIQKGYVEVRDPRNPAKQPEYRKNPFFESMPAPEVWHRKMPPCLQFGETPDMEKSVSDPIDEDLARGHNEAREEATSSPQRRSVTEAIGSAVSSFTSLFTRSPKRAMHAAVPEGEEQVGSPAASATQSKDCAWRLPGISAEEVDQNRDAVLSPAGSGKRSAGSQAFDGRWAGKRPRVE